MTVRRSAAWLCLAAAVVATPALAQPGIAVRYYHFDISIPDSGPGFSGRAAIGFIRDAASDTLRLDLVGMQVDSVASLVTTLPLPYVYDGRSLRVALPPKQTAESRTEAVQVVWHGVPGDGLIIGRTPAGRRAAFGDNWPQRARYWIPTVDDPSQKARAWWTITVPAGWQAVANGRAQGSENVDGGRVRWVYRETHPIPTYTMVIGASRMTVSRRRPVVAGDDTIPIEVWAYPEDSAFADSMPFRRVTEVVETLQRIVGPFPYAKLAHVESATRYGGMENSSAIFYAEQMYARRTMGEGVARHETAHQWFGDAVTERDFHHLWLSEGFASYFDLVAGAALDGDTVLENGMRREAREVMGSRVVDRPILDTTVTDPVQLLNANSYQKGAWVLHMLRRLVGDTAFFAGIRDYYRTYRDSSVLSGDFQRVMERSSGGSLGWFFDQWLRQPGYPRLNVAWSWDPAAREVVLDVAQVQPAAWGTFRLPKMALELAGSAGASERRQVDLAAERRQTLRIPLPTPPADVRVDPDGALLLTAAVSRSRGTR